MAIEITSQSLAGTPSEEPAVYKGFDARQIRPAFSILAPNFAMDPAQF